MGLAIKDGAGDPKFLKSTLAGTEHVVHRHVDSMPATAASSGAPAIPDKVLLVGAQHASGHCVPLTTDSSGYLNTVSTITGVSTLAKQNEIIGHVDGIETLQTTANGILGTIDADTSLLSGCVDSTKLKAILQANDGVDIGNVDVASVAIPAAVFNGQKAVAVTNTAIALDAQALASGITVKALAANGTAVYVGTSTVSTSNGFELAAKESVFLEVDNASDVYINGAAGVGVCWVGS